MNKNIKEKLLEEKNHCQEMVSMSKQEEEKKLAKIAKEKEQAEEHQRRALSRIPKSRDQGSLQDDQVKGQGPQVEHEDVGDGDEDEVYNLWCKVFWLPVAPPFRQFNQDPGSAGSGSRAILEALTHALDAKDGPTAQRLVDSFNDQFGAMVSMDYD
ncbi:uncharacterized protein MELLADRAFT_114298 [Melampsora larici-populina 98AG31]|uniref:Uncharacterized protein n=1 Tax=Melampsora larici-populina (strain 98AG31 / pathotype 3-4-7) TaxID=747676 RepID=F4SCY1_MELLP|nr:uncharacterized protein MELLADRAFT_114298 [Melampsora larici-populina 98AG31]EGF97491.1 hypothetical protein MELLADRAFT_114298 [Melampsora larici-populina 98AG31]